MKQIIILCLSILSAHPNVLIAQRVDLDAYYFKYQCRNLPLEPLDKEYRTYSVKVTGTRETLGFLADNAIINGVTIGGWRKTSDKSGHLIVTVDLSDLLFDEPKMVSRVETTKDRAGVEHNQYFYHITVQYQIHIFANVVDYKGKVIRQFVVAHGPYSYSTESFSTDYQATDHFNNNRQAIRGQVVRLQAERATSDITSTLSNKYGFGKYELSPALWILDSKKHPEYALQQANWQTFKRAMALVTFDEFPPATRDTLAKVAEYFNSVPLRYSTDDKGDRKLRYAAFYNRAKIFSLLLDLDNEKIEADKLINNDYDAKDGEHFLKDAELIKQILTKNNVNTRNFPVDETKFQPPGQ